MGEPRVYSAGPCQKAQSLLGGYAESSTSSSQTPKALGDLALEPDRQQSPIFRVRLAGGSAKAPKLRVLEEAAAAGHKQSHTEMNIDITSTYLLTKVSKMDTTIKKIRKRVVQHEHETQQRLLRGSCCHKVPTMVSESMLSS